MLKNVCHFNYKYRKYGIFINVPASIFLPVARYLKTDYFYYAEQLHISEIELTHTFQIFKKKISPFCSIWII